MEQIVDYLANGQERVSFPGREAKQIRNHPFMTQLEFFDMQEEQQKAWAGTVRKEEAKQVAEKEKTSEAMDRGKTKTTDFGSNFNGVSDKEFDQTLASADEVKDFTDELKTIDTGDLNNKLSNAQTMHALLNLQAKGSVGDPPFRERDRRAADDEEEEEEPGHPSGGYREERPRIREKRGRGVTGPDGESIPVVALKEFGRPAAKGAI